MIIKAEKTGRKAFGDKVDETESIVTVAGVKMKLRQFDSWSSGQHVGDGMYIRITSLHPADRVDPWPNLKG